MSPKTIRFSPDDIKDLTTHMEVLGFSTKAHNSIIDRLAMAAARHRELLDVASKSPRIAEVRHVLLELRDNIRNNTPLPDRVPLEVWKSLFGLYPASNYEIVPYPDEQPTDESAIALPMEIEASEDIICNALSNFGPLIKIRRVSHQNSAILYRLFGQAVGELIEEHPYNIPGEQLAVPLRAAKIPEKRLQTFTTEERQELLAVFDWAIARVEKTCNPTASNPGRRTTFSWATGLSDRNLVSEVVCALWPENFPNKVSSQSVKDIVNIVMRQLHDNEEGIADAPISYTLRLRRLLSRHRDTLQQIFSKMDELNQTNAQLYRQCDALEHAAALSDSTAPDHVDQKNQLATIRATIRQNSEKVTALDHEYCRLQASWREINRRLRTGDHQRPARNALPRISGTPGSILRI